MIYLLRVFTLLLATTLNAQDLPFTGNGEFVKPQGIQPDGDYVTIKADGIATDVNDSSVQTSTPLGAGATYTSGWVDTDGFKSIEITINTDQISASHGVVIEFTDNANVPTPTVIIDKPFTLGTEALNGEGFNLFIPPRLDGFRIKYTNGATPQTEFFLTIDLRTNAVQPTSLPIESIFSGNTNANLSRSIISGQLVDENLVPTGEYGNAELTRNKSLKTQSVHETLYEYATPTDGSIPSGAPVAIDPILNTQSNFRDSGWLPVSEFKTQDFHIKADQALKVFLLNASDSSGNNIQGDTFPTLVTTAGNPSNISARFFDKYFRVVICNDSGSTVTEITARSTGGNGIIPPIDIGIDQTVFDFFPAPLTQSAIRTYNETAGTLDLLQSSPSGSMQVAITDRPSEVRSRTHFHLVVDSFTIGSTQTVHYTVPVGQTLYLHSVVVQFLNDQNQSAVWDLRDDTTPLVTFLAAAKNVGGNAGVAFASPSLPEPIKVETNLNSIRTSVQGTLEGTITFVGYLEPN